MDTDHSLPDVFDVFEEVLDQDAVFMRHRIADGVRNVDGRRAGRDDGFGDLREKFRLGPGGVFRRELDILDERAGALDAFDGAFDDFVLGHFEFVLAMNGAGGEEDVDAGAVAGRLDGCAGAINVFIDAAGEAGNARALDFSGDGVDGLEIAIAGNGETGFDDVHLQAGELAGDFQFFAGIHGRAGALLAVAESGVEDQDLVMHVVPFAPPRCREVKKPTTPDSGRGSGLSVSLR